MYFLNGKSTHTRLLREQKTLEKNGYIQRATLSVNVAINKTVVEMNNI